MIVGKKLGHKRIPKDRLPVCFSRSPRMEPFQGTYRVNVSPRVGLATLDQPWAVR